MMNLVLMNDASCSCCIVMDLPSLPLTPVLQLAYSVSLICSALAWFQCNDASDELLYNDDDPSIVSEIFTGA
jgi:hypothetical protein